MVEKKFIAVIAMVSAAVALSSSNAATIPAGTTLTVTTVGLITSKDNVGRSFEAKLAQDVSVKGNVVLRAGAKVFGKVRSSRKDPRKNTPLTVELVSVDSNGRKIPIKTSSVEPNGPPQTARQVVYGHTAGTTVVNPGTKIQFQLKEAATL